MSITNALNLSFTINNLLYANSATTLTGLATADNAVLITGGTGIPSISSTLPAAVQANITQLGILTTLEVGNLVLTGNSITVNNTNGDLSLFANGSGSVQSEAIFDVLSGNALRFWDGANDFYNAFKANPALAADITWELPLTDSTGTQALVSNGSGVLSWSSIGGGTVTSVSGTANVITSTGGSTPVIDIAANAILPGTGGVQLPGGNTATRAGAAGTIRFNSQTTAFEGTVDGTNWAAIGGGSGTVTSVSGTLNQIDVATGTTTPVISIDAAYVGQASITTLGTIATGTWAGTNIALAHGGTNANLTASNGGIFYSTASAGAILAGTATANQILLSGLSTTPAWSTATYPATTTANQILYSSATNTIAGLSTANNSVLATSGVGVPSLTTTLPSAVQVAVGSLNSGTSASSATFWRGDGTWAAPASSGGNNTTTAVTQVAHGLSVGQLVKCTGNDTYAVAQADSAADAEVVGIVSVVGSSSTFTLLTTGVITTLSGLTAGTVYFLDPAVAGGYTATMPSTAGQINKPVLVALDTTSALFVNMRGEVVPSAITSNVVNQATSSATLNTGKNYICNNGASLITYTLPTTASIGDTYTIVGGSSGGWKVAQNASQVINIDSSHTTTGTGGSIASTNQNNCITLTCVTTNTTFTGYGGEGNLTIV